MKTQGSWRCPCPNPARFLRVDGAPRRGYPGFMPPAQPNLQTWLDNWLGPSARASTGTQEASDSTSSFEPGQPSTVQDLEPSSPQSDAPDARTPEALTPEEIAQSYEDIRRWLDENPGIEQGIAGASASLPERNLFAGIGAGFDQDAGTMAMARFGASPGIAAIAGNALQPLRGIKEGYTLLNVV